MHDLDDGDAKNVNRNTRSPLLISPIPISLNHKPPDARHFLITLFSFTYCANTSGAACVG